jgi:hypothetical protein
MEPTTSVNVGSCRCAGEPHPDGDTVELRPKLGLAEGVRLQAAVVDAKQRGLDAPAVTGLLAESYLLVGVTGWNLVDEQGKALPVTPETIQSELLSDFTRAAPVSDAADALYREVAIGFLVKQAASLSRSTTTNGSTSPTGGGLPRAQKRSKRSSTTTTPTADTAPTTA